MPNTIVLSGCPIYPPEVVCSAPITPGHLIEFNTGKLRKHATASGDAAPYFAVESLLPDIANGSTVPIDFAYVTDSIVRWVSARGGEVIYAWVPARASAIVRGDQLTSNGDGTLKKYAAQATNEGGTATYTIQATAVVARADEAVDNSANTLTAVRIRVRAA